MKRKRLLIVALATIAAAVAVPIALHARSVRLRDVCRNQLRQIYAPMECCVPMAYRLAEGDALDPKVVAQYIKGNTIPTCPCGPAYEIVWKVGGPPPRCPVHGDLLGAEAGHEH